MVAPAQEPWQEKLKVIIASPDDDALRLNYARQWEREGKPRERAWLIRLQLKLAGLPGGADHPEWLRLATEAQELIRRFRDDWAPASYAGAGIRDPQFHRGFIECVTVPAQALLEPHTRKKLFESAPIRHLILVNTTQKEDFSLILSLLETEIALRILSLQADAQHLTDDSCKELANSKLRNLRWLSLAHNDIGEAGVGALADATQLQHLSYVNLTGNPGDPAEKVYLDQGVVVTSELPPVGKRLLDEKPGLRWLRRPDDVPSRFEEPVIAAKAGV